MELSKELKEVIGEDSWQFYRCYKCARIINAMELAAGLKPAIGEIAKACPCGSLRCQPTQITAEHYGEPQVIAMAKHLGFSKQQYRDDFDIESVSMPAERVAEIAKQIEDGF